MKTGTPSLPPLTAVKVLDQLRERVRYLHYSVRTEKTYVYWVRFFIRFHGRRHPAEMGGPEVQAFLSWLVSNRNISASTHKQALCALLFFYGKVLGMELPWINDMERPQVRKRLPAVLTRDEVSRLLSLMEGEHRLFAQLLYGTGMRITEGLQLRVKISSLTAAPSSCARVRANESARQSYWALMPDSFTSLLHIAESALRNTSSSAGEP